MRMQGRREKRDRYHVAEESDLYGVRAYGSSRYHEQPSISGHEVAQAASSAPTEPTCYPTNSNRTPAADNEEPTLMKPKRFCRAPGCIRVIKSQGHCQRHGAKVKRCRVEGCEKQAQGTHEGMCKRHWTTYSRRAQQEQEQKRSKRAPPSPSSPSSPPGSLFIW